MAQVSLSLPSSLDPSILFIFYFERERGGGGGLKGKSLKFFLRGLSFMNVNKKMMSYKILTRKENFVTENDCK